MLQGGPTLGSFKTTDGSFDITPTICSEYGVSESSYPLLSGEYDIIKPGSTPALIGKYSATSPTDVSELAYILPPATISPS